MSDKNDNLVIGFLEWVYARCPGHIPVMEALGDLYTKNGRYEEGLELDLRLTSRCPDNDTCWYNLACSYCRTGQIEAALEALRRSLALGYDNADWMLKDDDLQAIRQHPEFLKMVASLKS